MRSTNTSVDMIEQVYTSSNGSSCDVLSSLGSSVLSSCVEFSPSPTTPSGRKNLPSVIFQTRSSDGSTNANHAEISHASLGRLVAKLSDAHNYDTEFRDCFLLTYRCHSTAYQFLKKFIKRYKAALVLANPHNIECDPANAEEERFSIHQSPSTSSSAIYDVNTQAEANIAIMRSMSVLKYWIKDSGYIETDLGDDRKAQVLTHSHIPSSVGCS
jgi:hypothetical protein